MTGFMWCPWCRRTVPVTRLAVEELEEGRVAHMECDLCGGRFDLGMEPAQPVDPGERRR